MMRRLVACLAFMLAARAPLAAQEPAFRSVEATVSSVAGSGVYLDRGRDALIEPGDEVYLYPSSGPRLVATIESVSRSGSRARLIGQDGVMIGDRAEVRVPEERFARPAAEEPAPEPVPFVQQPVLPSEGPAAGAQSVPLEPAVEHPEWSAPPEEWSQELPLLAPPQSSSPAERKSQFSGRFYEAFDWTDDSESGTDYALARTGVGGRMTNPFGSGGELELDIELFHRVADLGSSDEEDTRLRIDRFYYALGGDREQPQRAAFGRFLQDAFPEFGMLDGVEYQRRTAGGDRYGVSLGFMPEHDATFETGDDVQGAAFYRHDRPADTGVDWGLGFQKSWHEGSPDRDLLVADGGWRPTASSWYWGTAFVDFYTGGDDKSGAELTELRAGARWGLGSASGLTADVAHVRWPDIERNEFTPITAAELEDSEVTRAALGGWHALSDDLTLGARVTWWQDEEDQGPGGELRADWDELFLGDGRLGLALFGNDASFSTVYGTRVTASKPLRRGYLNLFWEAAEHEQEDFAGAQEQLLQHAVRGSWDTVLGRDWDLSLAVDRRFGDEQDSYSLGFFLQRRF